jgi:hypothetical protein
MYKKLFENKSNPAFVFFLTFLISLSLNGFSQTGRYPVKRFRTFQQEEVSGVNSGRDRERQNKLFHWIYLELWPGKSIEITHLWINNEPTGFRTEKINAPVFQPNSEIADNKVVIPKTSNDVIQLIKTDELANKDEVVQNYPEVFRSYPLLIRYVYEGKVYFLGAYPKRLPKERNQ